MKEDKTHIDKLFNDSLNQRSFEVPEAFLEDLNKRLDAREKKGNRGFFFWFFILVFAGIGIAASVLITREYHPRKAPSPSDSPALAKSGGEPGSPETNHPTTQQSTPKAGVHTHGTTKTESQQLQAYTHKSTEKPVQNPLENKPGTKQRVHPKTDEHLNGNAKPKNHWRSSVASVKKTGSVIQHKEAPKTRISGKARKAKTPSNTTGKLLTAGSGESVPLYSDASLSGVPSGKDTPPKESEKAASPETSPTAGKTENQTSSDSTAATGAKQDTTLAVSPADSTEQAVETPESPSDNATTTHGKNWRTEVQIYGGLGANLIRDKQPNQTTDQMKNQSSILAPSFGVNGHASFNQFTFGLGLSYAQTGEKYTLESYQYSIKDSTVAEVIHDSIPVIVDTVVVWIPYDTTIYHTVQYQDSALQKTTFKNRYSWFSIPIYLGYRFELGKYELIPRIGTQFNIGIGKNTGTFPGQDSSGTVKYQAVKFNVSYLIQLEARRNFDNWYVFVNPYFKSMINPAISADVIRRRYSSWGIQFGIGLKL